MGLRSLIAISPACKALAVVNALCSDKIAALKEVLPSDLPFDSIMVVAMSAKP